MITFRSDGFVEYYLDGGKLWTSNVTVDTAFDGQADLSLYSWQSYYDNVLVTPEPASLGLLLFGGVFAMRR